MKLTEYLLEIPEFQRLRMADALDANRLSIPCSVTSLLSLLGDVDTAQMAANALEELSFFTKDSTAISAWIRSVNDAAKSKSFFDLVWSGPEVPGVNARETRQVFSELIASAQRTIWASTYAYFDGPRAFQALSSRLDAVNELRLILMLNIQRPRGDTSDPDDVIARFASQFWTRDWPGKRRPDVFYDPRSVELGSNSGLLHAKCLIVDEKALLITSANMTEAALDRNFELGLLVRDPALAASAAKHFATLVDRKALKQLP